MNDTLELVTTQELVAELKKRHDVLLFATLTDLTSEHERMAYSWQGGSTCMLGLLCRLRKAIMKGLR